MHTILVRVCPDRKTAEKAIQRMMRIEGPVPQEGAELHIPALNRSLKVLMHTREKPATAECAVWCIGSPHDIVFLRGVEHEWKPASCLSC
jgi:hypothetical protein